MDQDAYNEVVAAAERLVHEYWADGDEEGALERLRRALAALDARGVPLSETWRR